MEDRLQKFARIVETGSFTRAARELHISQPALSSAVRKLERELKAELLIRGNRRATPTKAGQAAYEAAKNVSLRLHNLEQHIAELTREKPHIAIGLIDSMADALFIHRDSLRQLDEIAQVSLEINNSSYLIRAVEQGRLDVALVARQLQDPPASVELTTIGNEPLLLVTHQNRYESMQAALKRGQLPDFLSYNQHSNTCTLINQFLRSHGVTPQPVFHSTSPEVMLQLVLAGRGIAVLPYLLVRESLRMQTLLVLRVAPKEIIDRPIVALQQKGKRASYAAELLVNLASQALADLQTQATK